jgi:AcrR family transcriptional regulator
LIAAAKTLIAERGYEATTLRDVAALATLSTGAIFGNFADKADLFNEVIIADHAALLEEMHGVVAAQASPSAIVLEMLMLGYERNFGQLSLMKMQIGYSWLALPALEQRSRACVGQIVAHLAEVLDHGVSEGQLPPTLAAGLAAQMIWDSYVANYRHAIFDGWTLGDLRSRLFVQIKALLQGRPTNILYPGQASVEPRDWEGRSVPYSPSIE